MDSISRNLDLQGAPPSGDTAASGPPPEAFNKVVDDAKLQAPPDAPPAEEPPAMPSATDKRPESDTRSAQEIIDANPTLKNLGNQSGVKDKLKEQVGDFEKDPDAAYRASEVLDHIKSSKTSEGKERSGDVKDNGKIEGFTKDGDARHGTEAGLLQDFGKNGYSALKSDQTLDKTSDKHVKEDGTNLDNAAVVGAEILDVMSKAVELLGEILDKTLGKIPGIGKLISAGADVMTTAVSGGLHVGATAARGGDVKEAAEEMGYDVAQSAMESVVGIADPTGLAADAAGRAFRQGIDKKGSSLADSDGGGSLMDDLGGASSGKKGKGRASEDSGNAKGSVSADGGSPKGGVLGDNGAATADRSPPKRAADDAGLPSRANADVKAPRTDVSTNGTYGNREKEKDRLGIQTGSATHQSEHIVGFAVLHGDRKNNRATENAMPAYHEAYRLHRDHAGTGSSSKPDDARADKTGWRTGEAYRNDQRTALQEDPIARRDGTALSNAYQLNQLGYGQQAGHTARQPGQAWPSPDPKASNSYANTVRNDPGLTHTLPSGVQATDHLGPRGQAEAQLAHEARTTGQWPTLERENEVRKQFGV